MRPRKLEYQGLPSYVFVEKGKRRKDGSYPEPYYVYRPPGARQIVLGRTKAQMYREYIKITETPMRVNSMGDLIERYLREIASAKPEKSYNNEMIKANFLIAFFKDFQPEEVTPQDIYEYMDARTQKIKTTEIIKGRKVVIIRGGQVAANRELSFLSCVCSFGIRKGILKNNPCSDVKKFKENPRDRYTEDHEYSAVYNEASEILKCILDFELIAGQRIGDARNIKEQDITEEGIRLFQSKSKNNNKKVKLLIGWYATEQDEENNISELRDVVNRARKLRGNIRSLYLFCKDDGQPYTYAGIRSMFERAMQKAIEKGTLKEKFHIHDLRAKNYSDDKDEDERVKRSGHVDAKMGRVYDRKHKKVRPHKPSETLRKLIKDQRLK